MTARPILLAAALAILPLAACTTYPYAPPPPPMPEPAPARPATPFADAGFATRASGLNRFIVEASRDAAGKAARPAVRAMAAQLAEGHQSTLNTIQMLAARKDGNLPAGLDTRQQTMLADLGKAGRSYDHDYLLDMINAHQDLVAAYQAEMAAGDDQDLKGFATANLQPTRQHLAQLRRIAPRR